MSKPVEFWVALAVGVLIVIERNKDRTIWGKALIAAISGGIGFSLAPDVSALTGRSETVVVMVLTAFGYIIVDVLTGLITDREFIKDIIRRKLK